MSERAQKQTNTATVLVDNTTLAATGRILYRRDLSTVGGRHARFYYRQYPDAASVDRASTIEFLTALVLFDEIRWDSASVGQEAPRDVDLHESYRRQPWVYTWFPLFWQAHQQRIIEDFEERYVTRNRLNLAANLSLSWVKERILSGLYELPRTFRVPLAYYSEDYRDREMFEKLNEFEEFSLDQHHLAIAMFLHRGLYYQSYAYGPTTWSDASGFSYLPHAYRACLLNDPSWNFLSVLCNDEDSWVGSMIPAKITPPEILREIDRHFFEELDKAAKIDSFHAGSAIGGAFVQFHPKDPKGSFEEALNFRETRGGKEVRDFFRDLVKLGQDSNKQGIQQRLQDLDKLLQATARARFGTAWAKDPKQAYLLNLLGSWKNVFEPLIELLPRRLREAANRVLYRQNRPYGFQILFRRYLDSRRSTSKPHLAAELTKFTPVRLPPRR